MPSRKPSRVLLEPIMNMEVSVPDECMGDVIGDLNSRRGKVVGMETKGHTQVIKAKRADGGSAQVRRRFARHHQRPGRVSARVVAL